jgi:hypothetical protein
MSWLRGIVVGSAECLLDIVLQEELLPIQVVDPKSVY